MGSSGGGGDPRAPIMPQPQTGNVAPYGGTAAFNPQFQSFLPGDPTAMATGLTPEMLAAVNAPPPPTQQVGPMQSPMMGAPPSDPEAGRAALAQAMLAQGIKGGRPVKPGERGAFEGRGNRSDWGGSVAGGRM